MMEREQGPIPLLGAKSVADACQVSASTVHNWLKRYPDMPQPRYTVRGPLRDDGKRKETPVWGREQLSEILDWQKTRKG